MEMMRSGDCSFNINEPKLIPILVLLLPPPLQCIRADSLESLSDMTTPPYNIPVSGADMASMNTGGGGGQMMNNNSQFANNNNNNNNLQIKSDYDLTSL